MSVAIGMSWSGFSQNSIPSYHDPPVAPRNAVELSREMLIMLLEHLSTMIASEFSGVHIRLVAHGGACMLLHPGLHELANRKEMYHTKRGENASRRTTTRDVDYIHRSFVAEYTSRGILSPGERLQKCIRATAQQFQLGADWMNSDADVALPMSTDPNTETPFDPIYNESIKENNVQLYTVFTSSNKLLTVVNVTPFWAVALKLVRYVKWDPGDICLLLLFGSVARGVQWTAENLEGWIRVNCSAMNYHNWDSTRLTDMRQKIAHAVALISSIGRSIMAQPGNALLPPDFSRPSGGPVNFNNTALDTLDSVSRDRRALPLDSTLTANTSLTAGAAWAGPASDAAMAARKDTEIPDYSFDSYPETVSSRVLSDENQFSSPFIPDTRSTAASAPSRRLSMDDLKKGSRKEREREQILQRRLKHMLQSDEPDNSDEFESMTAGTAWAGPASDAATPARKETPFDRQPETVSSHVLPYELNRDQFIHPFIPETRSATAPAPSRRLSMDNLKKGSRREKRLSERVQISQRRLKYMLRSDEPDDSDESESSISTSDADTDAEVIHRRAPVIPMSQSMSSIHPSRQGLRAWRSTPAAFPSHSSHSWTQKPITEEPDNIDSPISGSSFSSAMLEPHGQLHRPSHSPSWPVIRPNEPLPRRRLTSPLLERPPQAFIPRM